MSDGEEDQGPDPLLGELGNFSAEVREVGACAPPAGQAEVAPIKKERVQAAKYARPLAGYAETYGSTHRSLKNWIAAGRGKVPADLPPLDQPELMAAWWRRVMTHRVPERVLRHEREAEERARQAVPIATVAPPRTEAGAQVSGGAGPVGESEMPAMQIQMGVEVGADLGLKQLQALVSATFDHMTKALAAGNTKQAANLRREWLEAMKQLRSWEKDILKIQEGRGELLRSREVNSAVAQVVTAMGQSFYNAMISLMSEYAPQVSPEERRVVVMKMKDRIYGHLKGGRFASIWQDVAA